MIKLTGDQIRAVRRRVTWLERRVELIKASAWASRLPADEVAVMERKELDALYAVLGQVEGGLVAHKEAS